MTYFELLAKCVSIAAKIPYEAVIKCFDEYAEYEAPSPALKKNVPAQDAEKLLAAATSDPEGVLRFAMNGIPGAMEKIRNIPKQ